MHTTLARFMAKRAPYLIARKGVEVIAGLVTFAILARALTKDEYANYALIMSFVSIARTTSLPGLGSALSQAYSRDHFGGFGLVLKLGLYGSFLGSVILVGVGATYLFKGDDLMGYSLLVAGLCFVLYSPFQIWRSAFAGADEFGALAVVDSATAILKASSIVICAWMQPGNYLLLLAVSFLSPSIVHVAATLFEARQKRQNEIIESETVPYGVRVSLYEIPATIALQLDSILVFYFLSPESLAIYAIAGRIPSLVDTVLGEINSTLSPVFSRVQNFDRKLGQFFLLLGFAYMVVCCLIAIFFVPSILPFLAGSHYGESVFYAQIMTIGVALGTVGKLQFRFIKSRMDSRTYLIITCIRSVTDTVILLAAGGMFGLMGVTVAYGLKGTVNSFVTGHVLSRYKLLEKM